MALILLVFIVSSAHAAKTLDDALNWMFSHQAGVGYEYDGFTYINKKTTGEGKNTVAFFYERRFNQVLYWDGVADNGNGPEQIEHISLGESSRIPVGNNCTDAEGFYPKKDGYIFLSISSK